MVSVPVMRRQVARVDFDSAPELSICTLPVPINCALGISQRRVRFGQRVVNFKSLHGVNFWRVELHAGGQSGPAKQVRVGYSNVSRSVFGIKTDGLLEIVVGLEISFRRTFVPEVTTLDVGFISYRILRASLVE